MSAQIEPDLMLEAWGEVRSVEEWAQDERATAHAKMIRKRFDSGMPAEIAISFREGGDRILPKAAFITDARVPFQRKRNRNARFVEAFGVAKSLRDWADDYRCVVSYATLCSRIAKGKDPEWSIVTPRERVQYVSRRKKVLIAAFGEVKSVEDWAIDARCRVGVPAILRRLAKGMSPEDAIAFVPKTGGGPVGGFKRRTDKWKTYLAFGEWKTLSQWRQDPRCNVKGELLGTRIKAGWTMEDALTYGSKQKPRPTDTHGKRMTAFGETHSLSVWAKDPRCRCSYAALQSRVQSGVDLETALTSLPRAIDLTTGTTREDRVHTAFGEGKTIGQWARDPRCRCNSHVLFTRLHAGWDVAKAITTPTMDFNERSRGPKPKISRLITAFGTTKRATEWVNDPRCRVPASTICNRINLGWSAEDAITVGKRERKVMDTETAREVRITAWGETKTLRRWACDPRVTQAKKTILSRLKRGMPPEQALSFSSAQLDNTARRVAISVMVTAWGETKTMVEWESDPRCVVARATALARIKKGFTPEMALSRPSCDGADMDPRKGKRVTAWGETKFTTEWVQDERCVSGKKMLLHRLMKGWTPEMAMSTPVVAGQKTRAAQSPNSKMITAWGETKSAKRWQDDPRSGVSACTILRRVANGMKPEDAISKTVEELNIGQLYTAQSKPITAWGETKTAVEWEIDPRCRVQRTTFMSRIESGYTPERAIGQPVLPHAERDHSNGPDLEAFGEVKSLRAWTLDMRCAVDRKTILSRLRLGWRTEAAIITPKLAKGKKANGVRALDAA